MPRIDEIVPTQHPSKKKKPSAKTKINLRLFSSIVLNRPEYAALHRVVIKEAGFMNPIPGVVSIWSNVTVRDHVKQAPIERNRTGKADRRHRATGTIRRTVGTI